MKLYPWQEKAIQEYKGNGTIEAVTGSGKTLVGIEIAKKVGGQVIISAPSLTILQQWKDETKDLKNIHFYTFQSLCRTSNIHCDLLIVDECHRSTSPEFIKLYDRVKYKNILGLSATPSPESIEKCGPVYVKVSFDEANVSPFTVNFIGINLNSNERYEYRKLSHSIAQYYNKEHLTPQEKEILNAIIIKRRHIVYSAESRIPVALSLIRDQHLKNKKILVICRRIEQAQFISKNIPDIPHIQYHSGNLQDLTRYRNNEVKLCISVGMLYTGFNDVESNVAVVVSTPISKSFHYQSIGRVIRYKPGKSAEVFVLLANDTSDTQVLNYRDEYDHTLTDIKIPVPFSDSLEYYKGIKYSFGSGQIWRKVKPGELPNNAVRQFFKVDPSFYKKLQSVKLEGGSFVVTSTGVYTKVDESIIKVTDEIPSFVPKDIAQVPTTFDRVALPRKERYAYKGGFVILEPNLKGCHWVAEYEINMYHGDSTSKAQARKDAEQRLTKLAGY